MKRSTILSLIAVISCIMVPSALAGTWSDDFEDGDFDGWEVYNPIPAEKWGVEDGECSGEWQNADPGMMSELELKVRDSASWKDYTVKSNMKFAGEKALSGFAGIVFRETGIARGFVINAESSTAEVWKVFQEAITYPFKIPLPFTLSKDTWYELKIIAKGDHFELYIDGEPVGEFEDNSIPSGKVGLSVRNTHVHFDDVVITGPEIPDGGPGSISVRQKHELVTTWGTLKQKR